MWLVQNSETAPGNTGINMKEWLHLLCLEIPVLLQGIVIHVNNNYQHYAYEIRKKHEKWLAWYLNKSVTTKNFIVFNNFIYNTHTPHDKHIESDYAVKR